jgi:hypothetical protein
MKDGSKLRIDVTPEGNKVGGIKRIDHWYVDVSQNSGCVQVEVCNNWIHVPCYTILVYPPNWFERLISRSYRDKIRAAEYKLQKICDKRNADNQLVKSTIKEYEENRNELL